MVVTPPSLSRLKLLGLMAAFAGPLLLAAVVYFYPASLAPPPSSYGELVEPVVVLDDLRARTLSGARDAEPAPPDNFLRGRWTLLFWGDAACDLHCEAGLFKMRQARLALGRHRARVRTAYLLPPDAPDALSLPELPKRHPKLVIARVAAATRAADALSRLPRGHVYVVDPLGNLMIGYARDATPHGIVRDLKKLLRASRIG